MTTLFRSTPARFTKPVVATCPTGSYAPVHTPSTHPLRARDTHIDAPLTQDAMRAALPTKAGLLPAWKSIKGLAASQQMRYAHTDVQFPNMDAYRRDCTKSATTPARDTEDQRRAFTYATYGAASMVGLYFGKGAVRTIVAYKSMAADQLALASVEVDTTTIPEGVTKTVEWRGKPVFVRHRTQAEIEKERAVSVAELRHPQTDDERVRADPAWVVTLGVCTHLGCVPIANSGDYGGYYCPCHGSHYDTAGRIRKGPAPENLEVPDYEFVGDTVLKIGKE